jgi:hypothetical protein
VLVSGLPAVGANEPQARDDVNALIDVVARAVGAEDGVEALLDALLPGLAPEARESILQLPRGDGEELHAFASAVELLLLRRKQSEALHAE